MFNWKGTSMTISGSEIYLMGQGDFKKETYLIFGAKNKIQPNDIIKCEFRPVHWVLCTDYFKPDFSYYETLTMIDDVTHMEIYNKCLWMYDPEDIVCDIQKYAIKNEVNIMFSFPTKRWIIKKFESLKWCQHCNYYPCICDQKFYRECTYIYEEEW